MDIEEVKQAYEAPHAELFFCPMPLNLLVSASVEAEIEDWEIGEEL